MELAYTGDCVVCRGINSDDGLTIYESDHWTVKHAYPSPIKGWIIATPTRHVTTMHDLSAQEFIEQIGILQCMSTLMHEMLGSKTEDAISKTRDGHYTFNIIAGYGTNPRKYSTKNISQMAKMRTIPKNELKKLAAFLKENY